MPIRKALIKEGDGTKEANNFIFYLRRLVHPRTVLLNNRESFLPWRLLTAHSFFHSCFERGPVSLNQSAWSVRYADLTEKRLSCRVPK